MLTSFWTFWNNYGFEICVGLAVLFILITALFSIGKKGSWSRAFYLPLETKGNKRAPPPKVSKGEKEMTEALQRIFGKPFIKARPDFLRNSITSVDGFEHNLELDAWNEELGVCAEYQSSIHYRYSKWLHKNKEGFLNQKYRDELKRRLCKDKNLTLIEVYDTVKLEDIENYLRQELTKKGFSKYFVS